MRIDVTLAHRDLHAELATLHARMQRPGDVLHGLPTLPGPWSDVVLRYREADGEFYVYVEDRARGVLAGCTVFNRVFELDRQAGRYLRSPHSRYAQQYQRRGLATAVYRWALDAGLCLLSGPRQSPGAYALWQSLARSHDLTYARICDKALRLAVRPEDRALQDYETRLLLLGSGWTLARFTTLAAAGPTSPRPPH